MPSPLDERFAPFRKHAAAAGLFDRGVGIVTDLTLKRIELDSNRHLNDLGKREALAKSAHDSAVRLNGYRRTFDALAAANQGAKARLRDQVFGPDSVKMPAEWRTRAFDYIESAGGDASRLLSENSDLLHVAMTAPIPLRNVPRVEIERLADMRVSMVRPAEAAHIESETEALSNVSAQLQIAENAIRTTTGHGNDLAGFGAWLAAPDRQPNAETQKKLSSEIARVESEAILRSAATWDERDRKALWDQLMEVRISNT